MKLTITAFVASSIALFTMAGLNLKAKRNVLVNRATLEMVAKKRVFKRAKTIRPIKVVNRSLPAKSPAQLKHGALTTLSDGTKLSSIRVRGRNLKLVKGLGSNFSSRQWQRYGYLKKKSKQGANVQWVLKNLDTNEVVSESSGADRMYYGASVTKVLVGGAFLNSRKGKMTPRERQLMADMVTVSSNSAWGALQNMTGGKGPSAMANVQAFTKGLKMEQTRSFRGWMGTIHGNETTAREMTDFLGATYNKEYPGASDLWKIMHATRTGNSKAGKYIPKDMVYGGKTGTYSGFTQHPETRKPYKSSVKHHTFTFSFNNVQYGMTVLTDGFSNEDLAIIAGGVIREKLNISKDAA